MYRVKCKQGCGSKTWFVQKILNKNLRVTKEIWFENSGPSLIPFRFCKFSNWQTQCKIWVVDVLIMWRINVKFEKTLKLNSLYHLKNSNKISYEPWLKPQYYWPLSHGSNPHIFSLWAMAQTPILLALSHGSNIHIIELWAMAQTNQLLDFEPWLKLINYWTLSHGSNSSIIGLWAMALTHQLLDFEPWLKPPKNRTLSHGSEKFPSHGSNPHLTCRF